MEYIFLARIIHSITTTISFIFFIGLFISILSKIGFSKNDVNDSEKLAETKLIAKIFLILTGAVIIQSFMIVIGLDN